MAAPMDEDLIEKDDYYAWLGLSKEATTDEIHNAFRRFSRIYHPDKHATDPVLASKAESYFSKLQKAHEVLSDPHQRAIYDTIGVEGLETSGWEVVKRTRTPAEILEEYERLKEEREERRLQQQTNQRGNISVRVNATDLFEPPEYIQRPGLPRIEISSMAITQSVEAPLTVKDTAVLTGSLSSQNGSGSGSVGCTMRHVTSNNGWVEGDVSFGKDSSMSLKYFRNVWKRGFVTMAGTLQSTPHGHRGIFYIMAMRQIDKNLQGRIQWTTGGYSTMSTSMTYDHAPHRCVMSLQLVMANPMLSATYSYSFVDHDAKVKVSAKAGLIGLVFEYGCEQKITQFSRLGASVIIGTPVGVTLNMKLIRGSQTYLFPVHLAETIVPSAVFYATALPVISFFVVKTLLVNPFLKEEKEKYLQKKKNANLQRMAESKKEAQIAVDLMQEAVSRIVEVEEKRQGLVIIRSVYGKLAGDNVSEDDCIDVTTQLQALVKDSKLHLGAQTEISELPGFYDPCLGETKQLLVQYLFRRQQHECTLEENQKILLPCRDHLCVSENSNSFDSTTSDR